MLTVTGLSNAEYLISSVALSIDEYYAGVGESPGVWTGRWAKRLGLSGVVEAAELRALVEGKHPHSGVDLLAGSRPRSVLAFDLTCSAPKSVSLLWALADEPVAEAVAAAHREAVEVALAFLEEHAAVARVQTDGVRHRVATGGFAVAGFVHRTSRAGDPQLHTHCLVANLVQRATDGRHVAFDAGPLFEWARAAGSIYQNQLQASLSATLWVAWGSDRHNTRELDGFTVAQLRAFSKRSAQIEAELEATGASYKSPALRMQADDQASLATRTAKDHALTPALLAGRWHAEAEQVGLASGEGLERAVCRAASPLEPLSWEEIAVALVDPETGLCARSARFTKPDVVEQICALSAGRMSAAEITPVAERFLASELAVRLCPEGDAGRRRPPQWSTAAHRALEDRTVALIEGLATRPAAAIGTVATEAAVAGATGLGDDQLAALGVLAGEGASLRAVLSPAGYGKTTMLHAASSAAAADGRTVLAVATTAKAVAELSGAGLPARTIARLRIELRDGPLMAGTVVVLDEISQTPTAELEAVLAAVDACPGGSIWLLGDPRQSQPVGAGGVADHIDRLASDGRIPSARLTVNRRQRDAADREALDLLRRGDAAASQALREGEGWEHELASPAATRRAMAAAVCADIARFGAEQVAALVVSHADAEELADLIRARLAERGELAGPSLGGPGWAGERQYRAGDRVLLHGRCGASGSRLVNGTTATVTKVEPAGLTVRLDGSEEETMLPAAFVAGSRKDGAPKLSHAWARTVDGAQGGTWQCCHLLGSSSLDAYRGYAGQSRSRFPTHTWNTTRVGSLDHGGVLADRRDAAAQVADALARQPDPSLAAQSDPLVLDRQLRERTAEHERVLAGRPPARHDALAAAGEELRAARRRLADADAAAARSGRQLADLGRWAGMRAGGRDERRRLQDRFAEDRLLAWAARTCHEEIAARLERLNEEQQAHDRFEHAAGWRREDVARLVDELDQHWAGVVVACVGADDPLAYGIERLRHARATLVADRLAIAAGVPEDRAEEWDEARRQLPGLVSDRREGEALLAAGRARLEDASRRRFGRQGRQALLDAQAQVVAGERRVEEAAAAERQLRERLTALAEHQQRRLQQIDDGSPQVKKLDVSLAEIDAALDRSRPERVAAFAGEPPEHLVTSLGPVPGTAAGRAVWCHHALAVEADLDRNDGDIPPSTGWSPEVDRARRQIAVADRALQASNERVAPAEWADLAEQAGAILDQLRRARHSRAARPHAPGQWQEVQPARWIDPATAGPQSGIGI